MLVADVIKVVAERYQINDPVFVKSVTAGYNAENFIIRSRNDTLFFVKVYSPKRHLDRITEIHNAIEFFSGKSIPVITPLPDASGATFFKHCNRYIALFPYIQGAQFDSVPSETAVTSIGAHLAALHHAGALSSAPRSSKKPEQWNRETFLVDADNLLTKINMIKNPTTFDHMAHEFIMRKIELAQHTQQDFASLGLTDEMLLHGDFHYHNLFFDDTDQLTHIFDLERVMWGPRATELTYALMFNCFDTHSELEDDVTDIHFSRATAYLRSYNSVLPISPEQIAAGIRWFYLAQMVHQLWIESLHYIENNTRADGLLPKRLNRLKYFSTNLEGIIDHLTNR